MRRIIIHTAKILLFLIAFALALWYFFPWESAGKFALSHAHSYLSSRGLRLTYSDVTGTAGGFTVHNLGLSGGVKISFSSVTIRPRIVSSVLSLQAVSEIAFEGGQVQVGQVIDFGRGSTLLTVSLGFGEVLMENLHTSGPFGISGYLSVNPQAMRIIRADARLSVPEEFSPHMNMLSSILPLEQEGGRWYLRRK